MKRAGFSLIEVILALGIFSVAMTGVMTTILSGERQQVRTQDRQEAYTYAQQGLEAVRSIKKRNFALLTPTASTGVQFGAGVWSLSGTNNTQGSYTRTLQIETLRRNAGTIVTSGGTLDSNGRRVTSTVTWNEGGEARNITLTEYLTQYDLDLVANWASVVNQNTFDLTVANSQNNTANVSAIASAGTTVYIGRVNSGGWELVIVDVSNPASPTVLGGINLNGQPNAIAVSGSYAYIGSTDNSQELQVVDISTPSSPTLTGSTNLTNANSGSDNNDVIDLAVTGSTLVMVRASGVVITFNLAITPGNPGAPAGRTTTFSGTPIRITALGSHAYVTSNDNSAEIQVYDLSNIASPTRVTILNMDSGNQNADGAGVAAGNGLLAVGRASSGAPDFYLYSLATPATPALLSTLEIGSSVNRVALETNAFTYAFILTSDGGAEFQVVNISNTGAPDVDESLNANSPVVLTYIPSADDVWSGGTSDTQELERFSP